MKTCYVSKTRNLLTDPVITDYKIGNKEDLIDYIADHFNINKSIINFKFSEIRKMEDIYEIIENNKKWNIDDIVNLYNEDIIMKIDRQHNYTFIDIFHRKHFKHGLSRLILMIITYKNHLMILIFFTGKKSDMFYLS